jgi:hypothetical protein
MPKFFVILIGYVVFIGQLPGMGKILKSARFQGQPFSVFILIS